ncbi:hypothetical protein [Lentzea sp. NBRC 102530]|uniref:hypothetical protein n=1 Tax=Lentzea sp. NBRC 102530 TaxID=3032201 RepID=UPI0024A05625|nr:hypothetical protein [Lentzea sp. NBRC 102530]GLY51211.1 hypothetical protein Lesp01_48670 [Lentzea sp. NBRC 102530]
MRLTRLLITALLVHVPGWRAAGYNMQPGAWWPCLRCGNEIEGWTSRSACCPDDGWFLIGPCKQRGCKKLALRYATGDWEWECEYGHYFIGPSCPDCEYWAAEQKGIELVCGGPQPHSFYLSKKPYCTDCRSGYVRFSDLSPEAICEACGRPQPRR